MLTDSPAAAVSASSPAGGASTVRSVPAPTRSTDRPPKSTASVQVPSPSTMMSPSSASANAAAMVG